MKKLYLAAAILLSHLFLSAQNGITVSPGTNLYLPAGTVFSSGGLVLTPSSGITFNGITITKTTTVSHSTANNYISRIYQFSNTTSPFSGTIQFYYNDAELNGLSEANLTVNIHDGTSWQPVNSTTNDAINNYVLTNAIVNKTLNEITLADAFATLPSQWGNISAYRLAQTVKIEWITQQEFNVSHFAVERSEDGLVWNIVIDNIPATNTSSARQYSATDNYSQTSRLYYRIKETDRDGKTVYSPVVIVTVENESDKLVVYPNPVRTGFYISNAQVNPISMIQLYNNEGLLVKTWTTVQSSYDMQDLPAGIYHLRTDRKDGSHQYFKISK